MSISTGCVLKIGDQAPAFALKSTDGQTIRLSDVRGQKVILYFYPKDDTPGCTKEACSFRDARAAFTNANVAVLGISCDDVESHQRFSQKFHLNFPLLSDPDAKVSKAYGAYKQKSLYGRTYLGIERTTFVIDEAGRIASVFPKVRVDGHTEAVLQALAQTATNASARPGSGASASSSRRGD